MKGLWKSWARVLGSKEGTNREADKVLYGEPLLYYKLLLQMHS